MRVVQRGPVRPRPITVVTRVLMAAATLAFAAASLVHFGVAIPLGPATIHDPFPGAAIPEAVIAVVLGIGTIGAIAWGPAAHRLSLATTLFALLATLYGLSVTVRSARTGDIAYHVAILVVLVVIVGSLALGSTRPASLSPRDGK